MPDFKRETWEPAGLQGRAGPKATAATGGAPKEPSPRVPVGGPSGATKRRFSSANNYKYTYKKARLTGAPSKATRRARIERRRWTRLESPSPDGDCSRPERAASPETLGAVDVFPDLADVAPTLAFFAPGSQCGATYRGRRDVARLCANVCPFGPATASFSSAMRGFSLSLQRYAPSRWGKKRARAGSRAACGARSKAPQGAPMAPRYDAKLRRTRGGLTSHAYFWPRARMRIKCNYNLPPFLKPSQYLP